MGWALSALASAAIFALVSVLDKRILAVYVPGLPGFYNIVGFMQVGLAIAVVGLTPWHGGNILAVTSTTASGVLWGLTLIFLFYGLRNLEVSRAVPFYNTFPVFVAFLAVAFLGERLSLIQWLAIFSVIVGAGFATVGQGAQSEGDLSARKGFGALILASLFTAGGIVTSKIALEEMDLWNVLALRSFFLGLVLLIPGLTRDGRRQARIVVRNTKGFLLTILTEGVLAWAGLFTMLLALALGPASLVATLMSSRPVFVLIISVVLSLRFIRFLNEPLTRDALVTKIVSTTLVVSGVSILTLT